MYVSLSRERKNRKELEANKKEKDHNLQPARRENPRNPQLLPQIHLHIPQPNQRQQQNSHIAHDIKRRRRNQRHRARQALPSDPRLPQLLAGHAPKQKQKENNNIQDRIRDNQNPRQPPDIRLALRRENAPDLAQERVLCEEDGEDVDDLRPVHDLERGHDVCDGDVPLVLALEEVVHFERQPRQRRVAEEGQDQRVVLRVHLLQQVRFREDAHRDCGHDEREADGDGDDDFVGARGRVGGEGDYAGWRRERGADVDVDVGGEAFG